MADDANSISAPAVQDAATSPLGSAVDTHLVQRMKAAVERLERLAEEIIAELDRLNGDADLEPQGDDEPSLGFPPGQGALFDRTDPAHLDLEDEHDGREPGEDDEPPLGWSEGESLAGAVHARPSDEKEPSLGALQTVNQTYWGDHGDGTWASIMVDGEEQSEDEGGACEDEGAVTGDDEPWLNPPTGNGSFDFQDLEVDAVRIATDPVLTEQTLAQTAAHSAGPAKPLPSRRPSWANVDDIIIPVRVL